MAPQPAETWRKEVEPVAVWVERPLTRSVSRSQLVTRAP
ncbi:hypothetical protein GA0115240_142191 [Streptomyces sp. DvalAA-14]|nr:hypothetical protein GA0115240_142191 [Streptomyces sp. DvalAA-14]